MNKASITLAKALLMSVTFYDQNAKAFFDSTKDVDVSSLMSHFLPLIPRQGHILDAGCGSGRDSKFFKQSGYRVCAIDASEKLAVIATSHIGQAVEVSTFVEFQPPYKFDGIWACASLLHIPSPDLPHNFSHLCSLLVKGGIFYCSFKYGTQDTQRDGRYFTDCDENRLKHFVRGINVEIDKMWRTVDLRPGREKEQWLNAILIKK